MTTHKDKLQHSPLPWKLGQEPDKHMIYSAGTNNNSPFTAIVLARYLRGSEDKSLADANAQFIVQVCNNHHELIRILRSMLFYFKRFDKGTVGNLHYEEICAAITKAEGKETQ